MQLLLCNIDTNNNLSQFLKTPSLLLSENNISLPLLENQVVIDEKVSFRGLILYRIGQILPILDK